MSIYNFFITKLLSLGLLLLGVILLINGCAKIIPIEFSKNEIGTNIQLPFDKSISINIDPSDINKVLERDDVFRVFTIGEGQLMKNAAISVFGKIFNAFYLNVPPENVDVSITITGSTKIKYFSGNFDTDASALVTTADSYIKQTYRGHGVDSTQSPQFYNIAVSNSYRLAFKEIAVKMLNNKKMIAYLKSENQNFAEMSGGEKNYKTIVNDINNSEKTLKKTNSQAIAYISHHLKIFFGLFPKKPDISIRFL